MFLIRWSQFASLFRFSFFKVLAHTLPLSPLPSPHGPPSQPSKLAAHTAEQEKPPMVESAARVRLTGPRTRFSLPPSPSLPSPQRNEISINLSSIPASSLSLPPHPHLIVATPRGKKKAIAPIRFPPPPSSPLPSSPPKSQAAPRRADRAAAAPGTPPLLPSNLVSVHAVSIDRPRLEPMEQERTSACPPGRSWG